MSEGVERERELGERKKEKAKEEEASEREREEVESEKKKIEEAAVVVLQSPGLKSKRDKFDAFPSNCSVFRPKATSRDAVRIVRGFSTRNQEPIAKDIASFSAAFFVAPDREEKKKPEPERRGKRKASDDFLRFLSATLPLAFQV